MTSQKGRPRVLDLDTEDRRAVFQEPQLFEAFGRLEFPDRPGWIGAERGRTVGIDARMQPHGCGAGPAGDHLLGEIERPPVAGEGRRGAADPAGRPVRPQGLHHRAAAAQHGSGDINVRCRAERAGDLLHEPGRCQGRVPLEVDDHIETFRPRDSVQGGRAPLGAVGASGRGEDAVRPRGLGGLPDPLVIGGDDHLIALLPRGHGGLPAADHQGGGLAPGPTERCQRLALEAGRCVAGGDDDQRGHGGAALWGKAAEISRPSGPQPIFRLSGGRVPVPVRRR